MTRAAHPILAWLAMAAFAAGAEAQEADAAAEQASARARAPIDLTGNWVSLVTDDWVFRMLTPAKGDYRFVPLNAEGRRAADGWDPAGDEAANEQCKGYAAPAIMRLPARLRIAWEDASTLRMDIDTGTQTRFFRFGAGAPTGPRTWQGHSAAEWQFPGGAAGMLAGAAAEGLEGASLKVDTTHLRAGYLRKNGIPFSEAAFMTEYYSVITDEDDAQYLLVQIFVEDPAYLDAHFVKSVQFKRETDGVRWSPTPCSAY